MTHITIDGWKSYRREAIIYFVIDQFLHFSVIVACWYFLFVNKAEFLVAYHAFAANNKFWILATATDTLSPMEFGDGPAIRSPGRLPRASRAPRARRVRAAWGRARRNR